MARFRKLGPGGQFTTKELNRLAAIADTAQAVSGAGGITAEAGPFGLNIVDRRPQPIWARITGGTNPYDWVQVDETDTAFPDLTGDFAQSGTASAGGAYEISGSTSVPADTKVQLFLLPTQTNYIFTAPASASGGNSAGPGWLAGLATSQCLATTVISATGKCSSIAVQDHILAWDSGTSKWISPNDFAYDGGTGKVRFYLDNGRPRLTINNVDLVMDSSGVDEDGYDYVDWKGGAALSTALCTAGTLSACGGNTFTVRLRCAWCASPCCANYESPATLYLTITSTSCPAIDRVVTLPIATSGVWAGYAWYAPTGNSGRYWMLVCQSATWQLHIVDKEPDGTEAAACGSGSGFSWKALTLNDCSPYDFSFSYSGAVSPGGNGLGACLGLTCPDPTDFTITVTA